jgi:hypothetical protein
LIMTADCEVIAYVDYPHEAPVTGTYVVSTGPTVRFDPNDKTTYTVRPSEYSRLYEPCSQHLPTASPSSSALVPQSNEP